MRNIVDSHSCLLKLASYFFARIVWMTWQVERLIKQREAEATAQGMTWFELAADVDPDYEDPQALLGTPHACHVALINYMGPTQLFELLCQVDCLDSLPCTHFINDNFFGNRKCMCWAQIRLLLRHAQRHCQ